MQGRRGLLGLALGGAVAALAGGAAGQEQMAGFESGGRRVAVDWFAAARRERGPAVLLLHGAEGLSAPGGYALAARTLAAAGYGVALVHYLDRTGDRRVDYGRLARDYPAWRDTVADALGWLAARPDVDPARLGLVGISLGAALALSTAARDRRAKAVVDYFGPVPQDVAATKPRLPPTLILHGELDRIVPVRHAHDLKALLEAQGTSHELALYPGQGHGLWGPAQIDAASRTLGFLGRHL